MFFFRRNARWHIRFDRMHFRGKPKASNPIGCRTVLPCMRANRQTISLPYSPLGVRRAVQPRLDRGTCRERKSFSPAGNFWRAKCLVLLPKLLPLGFNLCRVVTRHSQLFSDPRLPRRLNTQCVTSRRPTGLRVSIGIGVHRKPTFRNATCPAPSIDDRAKTERHGALIKERRTKLLHIRRFQAIGQALAIAGEAKVKVQCLHKSIWIHSLLSSSLGSR